MGSAEQIGPITLFTLKLFEVYYIINHFQIFFRFWIKGRAYLDVIPSDGHDQRFLVIYYTYTTFYYSLIYLLTSKNVSIMNIILHLFYYVIFQHDFILLACQMYFLLNKIKKIRQHQSAFLEPQSNLPCVHQQVVRLSRDMDRFNKASNRILFSTQTFSYLSFTSVVLYSFLYRINTFYNVFILMFCGNNFLMFTVIYTTNSIMASLYHSLRATLVRRAGRSAKPISCSIRIDRLLADVQLDRQMSLWLYDFCPLTIDVFSIILNFIVNLAITLYQTDTAK